MQKPLALSIAACLALTSCQVFEKSPTWETVMSVRLGDGFRDPDPSSVYAEKLHRALLEAGVEHIVVTYQYRYYTHQYDEAVGTRTAVVYRDSVDPHYPWWLKDDRLVTPFWLPNGDLNRQISFYVRRSGEVIDQKHYRGGARSGKSAVALTHPLAGHFHVSAAAKPMPVTHVAQAKPSPPAKPHFISHATDVKLAPMNAPAHPAPVTKIQHPSTVAAAKSKPTTPSAPAPVAAASRNPFWAPPAWLAPANRPPKSRSLSHADRLARLFRLRHGTGFDPSSSVDRRKMEQLKQRLFSQI
jgi:hypothetical protein